MLSTVWSDGTGNAGHLWYEKSNFKIERPNGLDCYTFLHFFEPVRLELGNEIFITEANACILFAPNTPQLFSPVGELTHNWAHFDEVSASDWLKVGLEYDKIYYPQSPNLITKHIQIIEMESKKKEAGYELMIDANFSEMFVQIARSLESPLPQVHYETKALFHKLRRDIFCHPDEKWTTKRMAESLNMSETYMHTLYKKIHGVTPVADIINARITKAQMMLAHTDTPVSEIATHLGYTNPYHFSRQFKQITGKSPSQYRKIF